MTFPPPREFQQRAHEALREGARQGHRCQVIMAPTGAGKTYLGLRIAHEALQRGRRAIFLCDRRTLINQTSETADRYGLRDHGVMMADHWRRRPDKPLQIASAQTISRRDWPMADVLIVDECHTMQSVWTKYIPTFDGMVVGLSATPFSPGLGKLFTRLVNATTMHELTQTKVLTPMRVLSAKRPDMTGAKVNSRGEWDENEAAERGMAIIGDVVAEWLKHGQGRKTICFASNVDHCTQLVREFVEAGVMAAAFTYHTTDKERADLLTEYRNANSALRVLVSVEALSKGFDVPDVGCVIDCRPLRKSLSTAIQMWGRGLRSSPETGKEDCILLDHSGNIIRFREDFEHIYFHGLDELDQGEKLDKKARGEDEEKEVKRCPICGYSPFWKRCMSCGHERRGSMPIEVEVGEMREVVMLGGKVAGTNRRHVWEQAVSYARTFSKPERQRARAACIFKDITGSWPPKQWNVEGTPRVEVTRTVLNAIQRANAAYKRSLNGVR